MRSTHLDWHYTIHQAIGFTNDPSNHADNFVLGAIHFLPIYIVCMFVGGHIELIFSVLRGHEINEGFLVTGLLFPLTLPPTIPLWQVAVGIAFGVIVAKEVFGGTGRNFLNVALTSRAFLYFAYAAQISGDKVWTAVDGYSGATALGRMANAGPTPDVAGDNPAICSRCVRSRASPTKPIRRSLGYLAQFLPGVIPGSIGETSTLLCIVGAAILIATGIGSWKIMAAVVAGVVATSLAAQRRRPGNQSDVRRSFLLASGGWRSGIRFGLHGDRSGECLDDRKGKVDLRRLDRVHDRPDSRDQSSVSRRHHVGDSVRQCVCTPDRLFRGPSQRSQEDRTLCNNVIHFLNTLIVAVVLCVVCSLAVSSAAVILRPRQEANEMLDQQKNILDATGLAIGEYGVRPSELSRDQIDELNKWISRELVDLETGEYTDEVDMHPLQHDRGTPRIRTKAWRSPIPSTTSVNRDDPRS